MLYVVTGALFILGATLTSFYTLVGMRVPNKQSITGRSVCDECGEVISWYALIPVLGYFLARGKCTRCHGRVAFKYPIYELIGGFLFVIGYVVLQDNIAEYVIYSLFVSLMIIVTVSDIEYQIVPNRVLLMFFPVLLVLRMVFPLSTWYESLFGALGGFLFMLLIAYYGKKRYKQDALGGGDIKLYVLIGLFLEIRFVFLSLFFASLLGIIIGRTILKHVNPIPFVPFIFAGALVTYYFGPALIAWYISIWS